VIGGVEFAPPIEFLTVALKVVEQLAFALTDSSIECMGTERAEFIAARIESKSVLLIRKESNKQFRQNATGFNRHPAFRLNSCSAVPKSSHKL
jgi:hypothetical protein